MTQGSGSMGAKCQFVDVLRLEPPEVTRLLNRVFQQSRSRPDDERRCEPRQLYRGRFIILVQIRYPTREVGSYRAVSWNISPHGLGFLHGKFVFPGSVCRVLLRGIADDIVNVRGQVVRCQHLEGRIHDVGMRFETPLDLSTVKLDDGVDVEDADADADAEVEDAAEVNATVADEADDVGVQTDGASAS